MQYVWSGSVESSSVLSLSLMSDMIPGTVCAPTSFAPIPTTLQGVMLLRWSITAQH